jgi:parallel beta-helix repeat protein
VTGYFANSTFENNGIADIALVKNLGQSGMGCGLTTNECTENGDGFRIRLYDVRDSGHDNTLLQNYFKYIGYNGVDVFGPNTILEDNYITLTCYTKADCGAVRTFGDTSLAATTVYNIQLLNNVIVDIPGNVDGAEASRAAFGMGLYIDNFSRNVIASGNTVVSTTVTGILYQQSTGQITGNTVFNAAAGTEYSGQIEVSGSAAQASLSHNAVYGLTPNAWTLYVGSPNNLLSSDQNYFFQPYVNKHIAYGPSWTTATLAQWQAYSGQDAHSKTSWFTQPTGQPSRGRIFYNSTTTAQTIDLGSRQYLDLDQTPVIGSLTLAPFTSRILVDNGPAPLTLQGLDPALAAVSAATNFTLTVTGTGFTGSSVVRWNGSNRPTVWINSTHLSAVIAAADVSALGAYPVTVRDGGTETAAVLFRVVPQVFETSLPFVGR